MALKLELPVGGALTALDAADSWVFAAFSGAVPGEVPVEVGRLCAWNLGADGGGTRGDLGRGFPAFGLSQRPLQISHTRAQHCIKYTAPPSTTQTHHMYNAIPCAPYTQLPLTIKAACTRFATCETCNEADML